MIPAFNEERTIALLVDQVLRTVPRVIVIDDGSTDATAHLARMAGAEVYPHHINLGKAAAVNTACTIASTSDVDILVLLDGDAQHDPADIPRITRPVEDGTADIVVGTRFGGLASPIPLYRSVGLQLLNLATAAGSGTPCSDSQCGFRALGRRAFGSMSFQSNSYCGFSVESEMQFEIQRCQLRLAEVPITVRYDTRARHNPFRHGISVLTGIVSMAARQYVQRHLRPARSGSARVVEHPIELGAKRMEHNPPHRNITNVHGSGPVGLCPESAGISATGGNEGYAQIHG